MKTPKIYINDLKWFLPDQNLTLSQDSYTGLWTVDNGKTWWNSEIDAINNHINSNKKGA